ncbi:hypothetical protein ACH5RR_037853 [Cinchona calisaya]|uniref:Uncharacterized protein n=1 Tax=Cinchona calisaya TaxID=153742 RepID=A0ABD2YBE1_9GENT
MSSQGDPAGGGPSTAGGCNYSASNQIYKNQLLILGTMIQFHYENGVYPYADSLELFEQVKTNGIADDNSLSPSDVKTLIGIAKSEFEMDVEKEMNGETPSFKLHPHLERRFVLAKKIWGTKDDDDHVALQERVSIDPATNRPVVEPRKIKGPPHVHQENQENDDDQESVGENKDVVETHSDYCRELDTIYIKMLKCILDLEQQMNDGVLSDDFARSEVLRDEFKSRTGLSLKTATVERMINELETSFWENVGEYVAVPLHREIFDL